MEILTYANRFLERGLIDYSNITNSSPLNSPPKTLPLTLIMPGETNLMSFPRRLKSRNMSIKTSKASAILPPFERTKEPDYVLTPGQYVGLPDDKDDFAV